MEFSIILLGFRTGFKEDIPATTVDLVYGIVFPGNFFVLHAKGASLEKFVETKRSKYLKNLKDFIRLSTRRQSVKVSSKSLQLSFQSS